MYNDPIATKKFEEFTKEHGVKSVFETGTWKGIGTLWFLHYVDEVFTVEIDQKFYMQAQARWLEQEFKQTHKERIEEIEYVRFEKQGKTIHHFFGDSVEVMDLILSERKDIVKTPCLFYLDAHWDHEQPQLMVFWPILKELQILAKHKMGCCPIIVHDVKHPTKNFGYDEYQDQPLDVEYMEKDIKLINPNYKIYHNDNVSDEASGRGILYIAPESSDSNDSI